MRAKIRLREREKAPAVIELALSRIGGLLDGEGWAVQLGSQTAGDDTDALVARAPSGLSSWDVKALATRGKLRVVAKKNALRMRYTPSLLGLAATAVLAGYLAGWLIREVVQYGVSTREAARWFMSPSRFVLQYAIGVVLAYPLLRWRFTRMCRKALRLSNGAWRRYASVAHMWRRVSLTAAFFLWPFVEAANWWFRLVASVVRAAATGSGGFVTPLPSLAWATVELAVLTVAVFFVDWDAVLFDGPGRLLDLWSRWREPNET